MITVQAQEETQRHKAAEDKHRAVQEQKRRETDEQVGQKAAIILNCDTSMLCSVFLFK